MTFPSAPVANQPPIINRIYYARDLPGRRASHEVGTPIGTRLPESDELLMIQGPLGFDWSKRKWGLLPRLENGCLLAIAAAGRGSSARQLAASRRAGGAGRPDWFFVKLHLPRRRRKTPSRDAARRADGPLPRGAAAASERDGNSRYHYVTAREMYNLAKAAEAESPVDGRRGPRPAAADVESRTGNQRVPYRARGFLWRPME